MFLLLVCFNTDVLMVQGKAEGRLIERRLKGLEHMLSRKAGLQILAKHCKVP